MTTALRRVTRKTRRNLKRRWIGMPPPLGVPDTGRGWRRVRNFGFGHQCPICGSRLQRFITSPKPYVRPEALCPVCGSLEWHRFGWWYLTEKHGERIAAGANVLHVAAEPEIRRQLLAVPGLHYNALDLDLRRATVVGDLTALPLADGAIDLVYCSHVLEHVYDDRAAMTELRRIISPTGAALLQVPVTADKSWGDPTITDPNER
jgi:SAM-dependent methyltransferase